MRRSPVLGQRTNTTYFNDRGTGLSCLKEMSTMREKTDKRTVLRAKNYGTHQDAGRE